MTLKWGEGRSKYLGPYSADYYLCDFTVVTSLSESQFLCRYNQAVGPHDC